MNPDDLKRLMEDYVYNNRLTTTIDYPDIMPQRDGYNYITPSYVQSTKSGDLISRMNLIDSVTTISVESDLDWHKEHMHDDNYKHAVKSDLSKKLSEKCLEKSTFTQIALPDQANVRITAKCIVLSIDEFENIIRKLINVR